jgi:murein DD-endopeptidase MepM/ murein hydrolase activator NlpD
MRSRLAIGFAVACTLLVAGTATGQDSPGERKAVIDARIDKLQEKIDRARQQEGVLSSQIEAVSAKIGALQDDVDRASSKLDGLESVLALHQRKLDRLNALFRLQTRKLVFLQRQHRAATDRLNKRIVEIYTSDTTEPLTVVLEAGSFSDLLDQLEFLNDIGRQDEKIANEVRLAKVQMRETRESTKKTRNEVAETTRVVAARTSEQRAVRDRLAWSQRELATARREKRETLASVEQTKADAIEHKEELEAESAALAAKLRSSGSVLTGTSTPSAAGLVWPVHGTLTSTFGWRWGRMHEGIDLAVGSGTPVVAAAAGTVVVAGWMGGYGNLVVIDHGNGIATAYGHNTSVTVGVGQQVAQGQLISYSGNTGHSTGPHVHFEVRVNGSPVDPLGYL